MLSSTVGKLGILIFKSLDSSLDKSLGHWEANPESTDLEGCRRYRLGQSIGSLLAMLSIESYCARSPDYDLRTKKSVLA